MALNAQKIRLGAADAMILQFPQSTNPTQYDLGASQGGCTFNYNSTYLQIEVDQSVMPLQQFRTKEEITFTTTLLQIQMSLVNLAFGAAGSSTGVTTTATGTLATPAAPTITVTGGAAGSFSYTVTAFSSSGDSLPSTAGTTSVGPTSLSATAYNTITHVGNVTGAVGYKIRRSVGGTTQGVIYTLYGNQPNGFSINDTGLPATAYTAPATSASYPNVDSISVGGSGAVPSGTFYASMPKNDGTSNHIRLVMNKVVSYKAIKIDFARDKVSSLSGMELAALADTTQPVGQQGFSLYDEG